MLAQNSRLILQGMDLIGHGMITFLKRLLLHKFGSASKAALTPINQEG